MYMESHFEPDAPSMNVLIDLPGSELPDEYVVIGGHGDSWDVAEGAMDDGGGAFAGWHAVRMLSVLGIKPRRTVRAVVWTKCVRTCGSVGTERLWGLLLPAPPHARDRRSHPISPYQRGERRRRRHAVRAAGRGDARFDIHRDRERRRLRPLPPFH